MWAFSKSMPYVGAEMKEKIFLCGYINQSLSPSCCSIKSSTCLVWLSYSGCLVNVLSTFKLLSEKNYCCHIAEIQAMKPIYCSMLLCMEQICKTKLFIRTHFVYDIYTLCISIVYYDTYWQYDTA